jgi:anti-anti-sigma regulatory factor
MSCKIIYEKQKLFIAVNGIFSHDTWIKFKDLDIDFQEIKECEVDFSQTVFIDSRGIGGLLVLKEKVGDEVEIILTNTSKGINKIITSVNFDDIFTLS